MLWQWGRRTYPLPPLDAGSCRQCGASRVSVAFSFSLLAIFVIFGAAWNHELQWACPKCRSTGAADRADTAAFVSAHGSPIRWRDRFGLLGLIAAIVIAGLVTGGNGNAVNVVGWILIGCLVLVLLTVGGRTSMRIE